MILQLGDDFMNFKLTQEQESIKNTVREFAETKIEPIAFQLDEKSIFPEKIVKEMGQLSIMGWCWCYFISPCVIGIMAHYGIWNRRSKRKISNTTRFWN